MAFENLGEMAKDVEHRMNGQMKHLSKRMKPYGQRLSKLSKDLRPYSDRAVKLARENPRATLAGVFVLGWLFAKLGRRS
jgi:hypothetical protein